VKSRDVVAGYLYRSDFDVSRDQTVCEIVGRTVMFDEGFGTEPSFLVRFADGTERDVLGQQLSPWFPV
jgi:hypothetical protein